MAEDKIYAIVDYEDEYVQPLLLAAIKKRIPPEVLVLINDISALPSSSARTMQWRQYESIDFDHLLAHPTGSLANSYIIRKALIRKHYLSNTVHHWLSKNPESVLKDHIKPSVEFEVDYAEFLDDALVEAWELKESWERNATHGLNEADREWWILKPGMSDRGQGIRLFSSLEDMQAIFEAWEPTSDDDESDEVEENASFNGISSSIKNESHSNGILTSQLRHFVAQPYIHPPLLLPEPHASAGRKFHIRTYVLAVGALKVYIYKPMLALFAAGPYAVPDLSANNDLSIHLTNTCLQSGEREGSVEAFWDLPSRLPSLAATRDWREDAFSQICTTTGEVFLAAVRTMGIHFQPLPNAFEIFALDFLLDAEGTAWLLEVNAFPDFKQTGGDLKVLIAGLLEAVIGVAVQPFFDTLREEVENNQDSNSEDMVAVLDIDLGRR